MPLAAPNYFGPPDRILYVGDRLSLGFVLLGKGYPSTGNTLCKVSMELRLSVRDLITIGRICPKGVPLGPATNRTSSAHQTLCQNISESLTTGNQFR